MTKENICPMWDYALIHQPYWAMATKNLCTNDMDISELSRAQTSDS